MRAAVGGDLDAPIPPEVGAAAAAGAAAVATVDAGAGAGVDAATAGPTPCSRGVRLGEESVTPAHEKGSMAGCV